MIIVNFDSENNTYKTASGLWQWDYGQNLRIQGLSLPPAVEIHFSLQQSSGEAVTRIGITKDGVTDVTIPDSMLENDWKSVDYYIYAFVYISDGDSGQTEYRISMSVKSRPKPEAWSGSGDTTMGRIMDAVNQIAAGKADGMEYKDGILRLLSGEKELAQVTITIGSGGGTDAREIELKKGETAIQWRYVGDPKWTDLISLAEITGPEGPAGANGQPGQDGVPGADGKSAYQYAQDGGYTGTEAEFAVLVGMQIEKNTQDISKLSEEKVGNPPTGAVGQILEIETVDENGKPKTYKAVDKPVKSENVNGNTVFYGMTMSVYGDSITAVNSRYTKGYYTWIKEILGLSNIINHAVSGHATYDCYDDINDIYDDSDILCVMIGVNDSTTQTNLGDESSTERGTTYGNYWQICKLLKEKYPDRIIMMITPHFQTEYPHSGGITSYDISEAMINRARRFSIPIYDNYQLSGIDENNIMQWTSDGCHWNDFAHEMVGKNVAQWMLNTFRYIYPRVQTTGISVEPTTINLTADNNTDTIVATVTPTNSVEPITWETSDDTIVTVDGGVITAIRNGSVIITAKSGAYSATCSVNVSGFSDTDGILRYMTIDDVTLQHCDTSLMSVDELGNLQWSGASVQSNVIPVIYDPNLSKIVGMIDATHNGMLRVVVENNDESVIVIGVNHNSDSSSFKFSYDKANDYKESYTNIGKITKTWDGKSDAEVTLKRDELGAHIIINGEEVYTYAEANCIGMLIAQTYRSAVTATDSAYLRNNIYNVKVAD